MSQQVAGSQHGPPVPAGGEREAWLSETGSVPSAVICWAWAQTWRRETRKVEFMSQKTSFGEVALGTTVSTCYLGTAKPVSKKPLVLL